MTKNYGPCVVVRPRAGGMVKFRFEVRRNRPEGWPSSRPILVDGRDGVRLADMTPAQEAQIERKAEELFLELARYRAGVKEANQPPAFYRSWNDLIALRKAHSNWLGLSPATIRTYESVQRRIVDFLGWDEALAPSTILESQVDKIFLTRLTSPYRRKIFYIELRRLLEKAVREGWRDAALTISYKPKVPRPMLRTWTAGDLACAVTQAITDGERGLALLMLAQWEIGQRLRDVRLFRYGYGYDYVDGAFGYIEQKTGREIRIKVVNPSARRMLDANYQHGAYMFPSATTGRPFEGVELTRVFTRLRKRLKGFDQKLHLRQFRHTVVVELALAGCTIPEIATVTGHALSSVHGTLKHYLRGADEMSDVAMAKRERRRLETEAGLKGELIVDGKRCIYIGDLPKVDKPVAPEPATAQLFVLKDRAA
jgi:hypothetical protein